MRTRMVALTLAVAILTACAAPSQGPIIDAGVAKRESAPVTPSTSPEAAAPSVGPDLLSAGDGTFWGQFALIGSEMSGVSTIAGLTQFADAVMLVTPVGVPASGFEMGDTPDDRVDFTVVTVRVVDLVHDRTPRQLVDEPPTFAHIILPGLPSDLTHDGGVALAFLTEVHPDGDVTLPAGIDGPLYNLVTQSSLFVAGPVGSPLAPLEETLRTALGSEGVGDATGPAGTAVLSPIEEDALTYGTLEALVEAVRGFAN